MPTFRGRIDQKRVILDVLVGLPGKEDPGEAGMQPFKALLDTGATLCGISRRLIEQLGLSTDEWTDLTGFGGTAETPIYKVSLVIPIPTGPAEDGVQSLYATGNHSLEVAELGIEDDHIEKVGFDVILGMDLLRGLHLTMHGDLFILSN